MKKTMNNKNLFGITGWKNSGKTHLVAKLVSEFRSRSLTVSTIKHAHHSFDIDHENTDTWQHRKAGAGEVAIVSKNRWALMHELEIEEEPTLLEIAEKMTPCDLILVEGYKNENHPKIETIRKDQSDKEPFWKSNKTIIGIVCDIKIDDCDISVFTQNDIAQIADFILFELKKEALNEK